MVIDADSRIASLAAESLALHPVQLPFCSLHPLPVRPTDSRCDANVLPH
jgi:hypothetical protein